ncbi:RING/U-box superfamily protein [Striga hermonthica]|uniref:RING/U-box superfamily protein n=1 Tax=Striga hermonthica TaxID=68872 RepID=A0A9N7N2E2_STRHE|nr:RING/U-box superfamily protein [Striga hermonthica]
MVGLNDNGSANANTNSFAKTICSICYEDFKPLIEDLQSISVCGHVFHEICLQQWFEYCPNVKKRSCPICKQSCTNKNVGRLYFQSIGDPNESSLSQKPHSYVENSEELRIEVKRLEGKVVALASTLEQQQKECMNVKDELISCKEQLKVEVILKNEAVTQNGIIQKLLRVKSEELDKSNLECMKLKERNMALARELAAIKIACDVDLEEDQVLKLASLGNDSGSKETVDVLRKSLLISKKNYKELMAKCTMLGRGEARCLQKLEKANDKIKKLKLRVQEVEAALEFKENEGLRVLKRLDSKFNMDSHNTMKRPANQSDIDETSAMPNISFCSSKVSPHKPLSKRSTLDENLPARTSDECNEQKKSPSLIKKDENITSSSFTRGFPDQLKSCSDNNAFTKGSHFPVTDVCFDTQNEAEMLNSAKKDGFSCFQPMPKRKKRDEATKLPANSNDDDDDDVICYGDTNPVSTSEEPRVGPSSNIPIRNEIKPSISVSQSGENCFSGGLLGPDGTSNWHLGKWCKKAQSKGSSQPFSAKSIGLNASSGELIAVGADGRGGKIKVIRPLVQSSMGVWYKPLPILSKLPSLLLYFTFQSMFLHNHDYYEQ